VLCCSCGGGQSTSTRQSCPDGYTYTPRDLMIENANNEERVNTVRSRQDCGSLCDARVGCRGFESDGKTCQTLGGSSPTPLVGGHTQGVGWTSCLKNQVQSCPDGYTFTPQNLLNEKPNNEQEVHVMTSRQRCGALCDARAGCRGFESDGKQCQTLAGTQATYLVDTKPQGEGWLSCLKNQAGQSCPDGYTYTPLDLMNEVANNEEQVHTGTSRRDCSVLCNGRVGCRGFESDGDECQTLGGALSTPLIGTQVQGVGWASCLKNRVQSCPAGYTYTPRDLMNENANNAEIVHTVTTRQLCGVLCNSRVGCRGFEADGKTCQTLAGSSSTPLVGNQPQSADWTSCLKDHVVTTEKTTPVLTTADHYGLDDWIREGVGLLKGSIGNPVVVHGRKLRGVHSDS